ncbi:MAG: hypothetical protein AAGU32_17100 [Bacillota bacterium]
MTAQEKESLKQEILSDLEVKLKGVAIREDTQTALAETRNKWFRDCEAGSNRSIMNRLFGNVVFWAVWELIRKLTCIICGVGYVRHLGGNKNANEIAEVLCQTVFDLRERYGANDPA